MNGDEVNSTEETSTVKALQDELESIRGELEGLKREKETLTVGLSSKEARISELEQTVASRDSELVALKQALAESDEKLNALSKSLNQAVSSYKALVIQANPDILEELISGDSIQKIDESVKEAKTVISKVRKGIETEASRARVPAGAPERTLPDLSALSAREKIKYAIGGNR